MIRFKRIVKSSQDHLPKVEENVEQIEQHIGNLRSDAEVGQKVLVINTLFGSSILVFVGEFVVGEIL